jgi:hypothetical protein
VEVRSKDSKDLESAEISAEVSVVVVKKLALKL